MTLRFCCCQYAFSVQILEQRCIAKLKHIYYLGEKVNSTEIKLEKTESNLAFEEYRSKVEEKVSCMVATIGMSAVLLAQATCLCRLCEMI